MNLRVLQDSVGFTANVALLINDLPLDLTEAVSVMFKARSASAHTRVDRYCTIQDAAAGLVQLVLTADDTSVPGIYRAVFEVKFAGSTTTVPNTTHITYQVLEGI